MALKTIDAGKLDLERPLSQYTAKPFEADDVDLERITVRIGIVISTNGAKGQRINREWVNAWMEMDLPPFYLKRIEL